MDIFEKLGIRRFINAHDTYTVYGGSRMAGETLDAMRAISEHFVDFDELQRAAGDYIARLTHNEGAFITNGAAGAIQLAAAVCMCKGSAYRYMCLPKCSADMSRDFVVMRGQHNAYDKAIEGAGGRMLEIGDADETLECELEGVLERGVAAVFYFASSLYARASLPLETVIEFAHRYNTPVIVDAAAQLPPKENLWKFTQMGADLVIFSGGKTLCGPQDSGLILGKKALIDDCRRFGAPAHGICRSSKTSRESIAGLVTALEHYLTLDADQEYARLEALNKRIAEKLQKTGRCRTRIVPYGPVGQTYPRLFIDLEQGVNAQTLERQMREAAIYIGRQGESVIYISPLNLTTEEADIVAETLVNLMANL